MKTAISIPDPVFQAAEDAAKRLAMSRSELYAKAIQDFLTRHFPGDVTEKLDAVYADELSQLDPALSKMQNRSLQNESW